MELIRNIRPVNYFQHVIHSSVKHQRDRFILNWVQKGSDVNFNDMNRKKWEMYCTDRENALNRLINVQTIFQQYLTIFQPFQIYNLYF